MESPDQPLPDTHPAPSHQKVWDVPTRLVHWSLLILIALSWWSVENKRMDIHYWSGLILIGVLATLTAPLGAALAHRLDQRALKVTFAVFLVLVGLNMIWKAVTG